MTLTELLKIDLTRLSKDSSRGLRYAENLWREEGCPTKSEQVVNFLENAVQRCVNLKLSYPPIFLRRKTEILCGQFHVARPSQSKPLPGVPAEEGKCKRCRGLGFTFTPGGGGTLCVPCLGRGVVRPESGSTASKAKI